ncbi:HlyD family efflux transporter periplasmic adaptor subunit [uncultured Devosia sp.]|uniref:efflux RND transporter periplasmic adaptor subunit n=1 Tax=uncultured Devosia sp. TaxID=211434 RepID=UPI002611C05A|nr:HlyD family efflux transporter periplasmic adaptor subunit [uncultured Devosia sp.]
MVGRIISIAVVALILAGAAWALWPRPVAVEVAVIGRGSLAVTVEEEGISRIREVYRVTAPVAGRLVRIDIHAGDPVTPGQTVAVIEPAPPGLLDERSRLIAEAAVAAAEAAVQLAEASLSEAQARAGYADADATRKAALAERGVVSAQVNEQATLALSMANRDVQVAQATLAMRQQDLESARATLIQGSAATPAGQCCANVPSPIAGQVLTVLTESEQAVQPGTPLMDLGDPANMQVVVQVLSFDAVRIPAGAPATIRNWGGEPLQARVSSISPSAVTKVSALGIEEQRTEVVLDLLDPPQVWSRLGHGFRVVADIVVWEGKDRVLVPIAALFRDADQWATFRVLDGKAMLSPIQLGPRNGDFGEVLSGLEPGDVVVTHPGDTVVNGGQVEVTSAP